MSVRWTEKDPLGNEIEMTEERWIHICRRHADMAKQEEDIRQVIRSPHAIYHVIKAEILFYYRRKHEPGQSPKYIKAVAARTDVPFILSSYHVGELDPDEGAVLVCMEWTDR